jgi:Holliday junction DNA helicase RuvA
MIGLLRGEVTDVSSGSLVLLCGAVGYEVLVPAGAGAPVPMPGDALTLHVCTLVRQDAIQLCGFYTPLEKKIFHRLLGIQGVGPRLALAVLGTLGGDGLLQAAAASDTRRIQSVPGVGRKTAERVVLELRDKLPDLAGDGLGEGGDAASSAVLRTALESLGFKRGEIDAVLREVSPQAGESEQQLVGRALAFLKKAGR